MRILFVSAFLPHAGAAHGGGRYLHALTDALATRADVGIVSFATPKELANGDRPARQLLSQRLVARPELTDLRGVERWRARARNAAAWAMGTPLVAAKFRSRPFGAALRAAIASFEPEVALVEYGVMAQYLPALAGVPAVLTDHEAAEALPTGLGPRATRRDHRLWQRFYARFYPLATRLQALGAADASSIARRVGRDVGVRPAVVPIPERAVRLATAPRALLLGDYRHAPNREAARFAAELWPRVRGAIADAELWLAGPNAPAAVRSLERPGVVCTGLATNLAELFGQVRCALCPVFSGTGVRIKVLDALAHGVPVVANALGLRGIDPPGLAARRAETPDEFATAIVELLSDPSDAGAAGRAWAEAEVSPDAVAARQLEVCREVTSERPAANR